MKNVTKINQVDFSIFKKTRVAAYCRVSTEKQTVNGNMQVFIMMTVSAVQRLQREMGC